MHAVDDMVSRDRSKMHMTVDEKMMPRSRRRRRGKAGINDCPDNKENRPDTIGNNATDHSSCNTLRLTNNGTVMHQSETDDEVLGKHLTCKASSDYNQTLRQFQSAQSATISAALWSEHSDLAECVIRASLHRDDLSGAVYLEEHSVLLLNTCRRLIREATEVKDETRKINHLFVAVHGLRSIGPIVASEVNRLEAALRLLYHLVTTAADTYTGKDRHDLRAAFIAFAGYEALGQLFLRYSFQLDKNSTVGFQLNRDENESGSKLFSIPVITSKGPGRGSMELREIMTVALKSTFAIARVLKILWMTNLESPANVTVADDYGELAHHLVKNTLDKKYPTLEMMVILLETVASSWISFLARSSNKDCVKDFLSYCQTAHKIYWETASHFKNASLKDDSHAVHSRSLDLRKCAVLALIPMVLSNKPLHDLIRKQYFNYACECSWKATLSFVQQTRINSFPVTRESPLFSFHEEVGSKLYAMASPSTLPMSFVEYCAYQSIHIGPNFGDKLGNANDSCITSLPNVLKAYEVGIEDGRSQTMLALLLTINDVRQTTGPNGYTHRLITHQSDSDRVIEAFQTVFIDGYQNIPKSCRHRCFVVLSMMSLHRHVFQILKETSLDTPTRNLRLTIAARILSQCIGPLGYQVLKNGDCDKLKFPQFYDVIAECYIRSAAAFENLHQNGLDYLGMANKSIHDLFLLTSSNSSIQLPPSQIFIEKAAKAMAMTARQRVERSSHQDSIAPLIFSLQLFVQLSDAKASKGEDLKYQLSARWTHLASVFQSANMIDEACLASVAALSSRASDKKSRSGSGQNYWTPIGLMQHFMSQSKGTLFTKYSVRNDVCDQTKSLIRRLTLLFYDRQHPREEIMEEKPFRFLSLTSMGKLLESSATNNEGCLSVALCDRYGIRFRLGDLLRSTFLGGIAPDEQIHDGIYILSQKVVILLEVLNQLGISLQRLRTEVSEFKGWSPSLLLEDYEIVATTIDELIRKIAMHKQASLSPLLAAFHIVACTIILPFRNFYYESLWESNECTSLWSQEHAFSQKLAETGLKYLDDEETNAKNCDWQIANVAMKIATYHFLLRMSRLQGTEDTSNGDTFIHQIHEQLVKFTDCADNLSTEINELSRHSLIWTLSHFQNILELDGNSLQATSISMLNHFLTVDKIAGSQWYGAVALSGSLSRDFLTIACGLVNMEPKVDFSLSSIEDDLTPNTFDWLAEVEFLIGKYRTALRVHGVYYIDLQDVESRLSEVEMRAERIELQSGFEVDILAKWLLSTIALARAESAEASGNLRGALVHLQCCEKLCQKITIVLKRTPTLPNESTIPFWVTLAMSTLITLVRERRSDCHRRRPVLYSRCGDYRKAMAYAAASFQKDSNGVDTWVEKKQLQLHETISRSRQVLKLHEKINFRLFLRIQSMTTSLDHVVRDFSSCNLDLVPENRITDLSIQIEEIKYLMSVADILYGDSGTKFDQTYLSYLKQAERNYLELMQTLNAAGLSSYLGPNRPPSWMEGIEIAPLLYHLKLFQARGLLKDTGLKDSNSEWQARALCEDIAQSLAASVEDRAWAFYHLGQMELKHARISGALQALWNGYSNVSGTEENVDDVNESCSERHVHNARNYLLRALSLLDSASDVFSRNVLRSLALVTGPELSQPISGMSSSALILTSTGHLTRKHFLHQLDAREHTTTEDDLLSDIREAFSSFDGNFSNIAERNRRIQDFLRRLADMVPANWRFAAPVLCPSGEILITTIDITNAGDGLHVRTISIFAQGDNRCPYDEILKPLDDIIQRSQLHLAGIDVSMISENFSQQHEKRKWWEERKKLDSDLQELIQNVETSYFESSIARESLLGGTKESLHSDHENISPNLSCTILASNFEASCHVSDGKHEKIAETLGEDSSLTQFEEEKLKLQKLTVKKLKARLKKLKVSDAEMRKLRKNDLIEMLIKKQCNQRCASAISRGIENKESNLVPEECTGGQNEKSNLEPKELCLFLILDENLCRFPFEGMSFLLGKTVCRVPSLPFVFATLTERGTKVKEMRLVNPKHTSYVLDPENNLNSTRNRLLPVLERLSAQRDWNWNGMIGSMPPPAFFEQNLCQDNGLLLYFGHGGGQSCFSRRRVEDLGFSRRDNALVRKDSIRSCKATVILMGCSSGRLVSINRKYTDSVEEVPLFFDPEGIALSYLAAGAPCVVGNLWDVTDHDIDRFSLSLLEKFLGDYDCSSRRNSSLAQCVSVAREACKLQYIVGCAPVCYGIPVELLEK